MLLPRVNSHKNYFAITISNLPVATFWLSDDNGERKKRDLPPDLVNDDLV